MTIGNEWIDACLLNPLKKAADPDLSRPEFKCQLASDSLFEEHESLI